MNTQDILIRLKRKYGKEELVSFLENKNKELEFKNGQLLSEIDYLNNKVNSDKLQYIQSINQLRKELFGSKKLKKIKK